MDYRNIKVQVHRICTAFKIGVIMNYEKKHVFLSEGGECGLCGLCQNLWNIQITDQYWKQLEVTEANRIGRKNEIKSESFQL